MEQALRIYVAGSSGEIGRVRAAMGFLREAGFTISHDWTQDAQAEGINGGSGKPLNATDKDCKRWAKEDLDAISNSDLCVFLGTDKYPGRGMHVELGYCIGKGVGALWAGHKPSIFNSAVQCFPSDAAMLRYVVRRYGADDLSKLREYRP